MDLTEHMPPEMMKGTQILIWKNKPVSAEDRNAYRPITLDAVEKKLLDMCLLQRIQKETELFLPEWAYGFVAGKSCRDALLTANMTNRRVTALQGKMQVALLDVKSAFTSVSHKATDKAMEQAGCSAKTRRIFRAIYSAAKCATGQPLREQGRPSRPSGAKSSSGMVSKLTGLDS